MLTFEMTRAAGFETLNVCAGEFTTFTLSNVPEILILIGIGVSGK